MKRIALFIIVFSCAMASFSETDGLIFSKVSADLEKIGPRRENSDQERAFFAYIQANAAELGFPVRMMDFSKAKSSHSFSRILDVHIEGRRSDTLVIAVAANTREGNKSYVSAAIALAMMDVLSRQNTEERRICVDFLFIGAEFAPATSDSKADYPLGSRMVISEFLEGKSAAVIYFSMDTLSEKVQIDNYAPGLVSPYWIFKNVSEALSRSGFGIAHKGGLSLFYRASLLDAECAVSPYLAADIPAIELGRAGEPCQPGAEIGTAERWISFLRDFIAQSADGFPEDWDRHYFILDGPRGPLVIMEPDFVLIILGVILTACLVFMLSSIFARQTVIGLLSGFRKSFFSLPLCLFVCLATLFAISLLMSAVFALKGTADYWRAAPLAYTIAHGAIVFAAFSALCVLLMRFKLMPLTISFYGAGSALLFFAAIFVYSAVDISFSVFFAWASIACLIAMLFRNRTMGVLSYLFIMAPFMVLLFSGGFKDAGVLQRLLIAPDFRQCVILAILVMPLLLFFIRLILLFYRPQGAPGRALAMKFSLACACVVVAAAVFLLVYTPFSKSDPIPVSVTEERENESSEGRLRVDSISSLSRQWIEIPEGRMAISGRSPIVVYLPPLASENHRLSMKKAAFLNRKRIIVTLEAQNAPAEIRCSLDSDSDMDVFDCSFPYAVSSDGKSARIFIGANPTMPLGIELTVSHDFEAVFSAEFVSGDSGQVKVSPGLRLEAFQKQERRSIILR